MTDKRTIVQQEQRAAAYHNKAIRDVVLERMKQIKANPKKRGVGELSMLRKVLSRVTLIDEHLFIAEMTDRDEEATDEQRS